MTKWSVFPHNTSNTKCVWVFFSHQPILWTPPECPIHFNSDANYLESVQTPKVKGSVPQAWPLLQRPAKALGPPVLPTAYKLGAPTTPSVGLIICLNNSEDSGTPFTYYYQFIIKAYSSGRAEGKRSQGVREDGWSFLASLRAPPSQHLNQEALWIPSFKGFYRGFITLVFLIKSKSQAC